MSSKILADIFSDIVQKSPLVVVAPGLCQVTPVGSLALGQAQRLARARVGIIGFIKVFEYKIRIKSVQCPSKTFSSHFRTLFQDIFHHFCSAIYIKKRLTHSLAPLNKPQKNEQMAKAKLSPPARMSLIKGLRCINRFFSINSRAPMIHTVLFKNCSASHDLIKCNSIKLYISNEHNQDLKLTLNMTLIIMQLLYRLEMQ